MCEWSGPRVPSVRRMFDDVHHPEVPHLFERHEGRMATLAPPEEEEGEGEDSEDEKSGEEGGPGPS